MYLKSILYVGVVLAAANTIPSVAQAQQKQPYVTHITYKGNMFEVLKTPADTAEMLNMGSMEVETVITDPNPVPLKCNNMNIYNKKDVEKAPGITGDGLKQIVLQALAKQIAGFADGEYRLQLNNIVISDKGKLVYYNFEGFEKMAVRQTYTAGTTPQPAKTQGMVYEKARWQKVYEDKTVAMRKTVEGTLDRLASSNPATVKGYAVPYNIPEEDTKRFFSVRKGIIVKQ